MKLNKILSSFKAEGVRYPQELHIMHWFQSIVCEMVNKTTIYSWRSFFAKCSLLKGKHQFKADHYSGTWVKKLTWKKTKKVKPQSTATYNAINRPIAIWRWLTPKWTPKDLCFSQVCLKLWSQSFVLWLHLKYLVYTFYSNFFIVVWSLHDVPLCELAITWLQTSLILWNH